MEGLIKQHWDCTSASYNMFVTKGFSNKKERTSWQKLFTEVIGEKPLNILDTGCGPGIVSMQLADLGHIITSIDFSDKMLEAAKINASKNNLEIKFILADAEKLPFENNSFDSIVSDYMLWTVPHPERVIEEWLRVLKPGCILAYVDGNWWSDKKNTPFKKRLAHIGMFIDSPKKFINDRKNTQMNYEIWSKNAVRPEKDIIMLTDTGFVDIKVIHNIQDRVLHGIRHLAYGSTEDHFMITAIKPLIKNQTQTPDEMPIPK